MIVGHLDSREGPRRLRPRAVVWARATRSPSATGPGRSHRYAVVGVTRVKKAEFPTDDVYGPAARPGPRARHLRRPVRPDDRGHYRDNVLVYARAV